MAADHSKIQKRYLGDAVYAEFDGEYLILTTSDGARDTNRIYLEQQVIVALGRYVKDVAEWREAILNSRKQS